MSINAIQSEKGDMDSQYEKLMVEFNENEVLLRQLFQQAEEEQSALEVLHAEVCTGCCDCLIASRFCGSI